MLLLTGHWSRTEFGIQAGVVVADSCCHPAAIMYPGKRYSESSRLLCRSRTTSGELQLRPHDKMVSINIVIGHAFTFPFYHVPSLLLKLPLPRCCRSH